MADTALVISNRQPGRTEPVGLTIASIIPLSGAGFGARCWLSRLTASNAGGKRQRLTISCPSRNAQTLRWSALIAAACASHAIAGAAPETASAGGDDDQTSSYYVGT